MYVCTLDMFCSPCMFCEWGWHCTALTLVYIGLIIHTDSPLTHPPMLTNTPRMPENNLKIISWVLYLYIVCFLTDLITILHFNICYMLHLWLTTSLHAQDRISKLLNSQFHSTRSFVNCVWCSEWRYCGNVFLPYSNDRLTLPFTQIWFDMLKLGPCPNPAAAVPQTPRNSQTLQYLDKKNLLACFDFRFLYPELSIFNFKV